MTYCGSMGIIRRIVGHDKEQPYGYSVGLLFSPEF